MNLSVFSARIFVNSNTREQAARANEPASEMTIIFEYRTLLSKIRNALFTIKMSTDAKRTVARISLTLPKLLVSKQTRIFSDSTREKRASASITRTSCTLSFPLSQRKNAGIMKTMNDLRR